MTTHRFQGITTVFLDADDTLWENNKFFLQTQDWLFRIGRELGHTHAATRAILDTWEHHNIHVRGYGYSSYEASLLATVATLVERAGAHHRHRGLRERALAHTHFLRRHPIVLCAGVHTLLPRLTRDFRTIIVTKGHYPDQMGKLDRCGFKDLFHACEVVPHKHPANYLALLQKYRITPHETVMVGNSPKSDINSPKRAGLRTIYVPHQSTWTLEMEPILPDDPPTAIVSNFEDVATVLGMVPESRDTT